MERAEFLARMGRIIRAQIPEGTDPAWWFGKHSVALDITEERLRAYASAENEMPASVLLRMFDHFGAAFEKAVRGEHLRGAGADMDLSAEIARLEEALAALKARHAPGKSQDRG